jgi:hypothetical protein
MQRPRSLSAFLALEAVFGESLAPPAGSTLRASAALELQARPNGNMPDDDGAHHHQLHHQPQQQEDFQEGHLAGDPAAHSWQLQEQQQQGLQWPQPPPAPRQPTSTQTLLLPAALLARNGSPSPANGAAADDGYSAGKARVPWPKLLRRHWFALRRSATSGPAAALAAAAAALLLMALLAVLYSKSVAAGWQVG